MKKTMFLSLTICALFSAVAMAAEISAAPVASAPATPPGHGALPPAVPAAPAAPVSLAGKVLETMNAGGYTYVNIEQADGKKIWVAVTETPVKVGADMVFQPGMEMGAFESKSLKRTFDSIVFSNGVISNSTTSLADPAKGQGVSPGSQGAAVDKKGKISVQKASGPNATTVEGAYKNKTKLNKKTVVVRGQVVKVSDGIMNKNWIHIQDGTGSAKKKNHNLVCTSTTDSPGVGEVVTITGTLIKDRDFGAGYKYSVIIEDAKVSK